MPRAVLADSRPDWAKPDTASVTDSAATRALRWAAWLTGADKPESQITALMAPLETGPVGGLVGRIRDAIRAYHASPHDFDRFDLSKIGTGEGSQAYGHGLYFAEAEPTMEQYHNQFSQRARNQGVSYQGVSYPAATDRNYLLQDVADMGKDTAIANLKAQIGRNSVYAPERAALQREHLAWLEHVDPAQVQIPTAHRYEVNLHVDPNRMLDWDQPIAEHAPELRDAVARAYGHQPQWAPGTRGADVYKAIDGGRMAAGIDSPEAARRLLREGVPGIKYLDQFSRNRPDPALLQKQLDDAQAHLSFLRSRGITDPNLVGSWERHAQQTADQLNELHTTPATRNFTLFDDSPIEILRKYGLVPFAPAAAAQLGTTSQQPATKDTPMPQAQPDDTMRAQLPPAGSIRRPITRVIDGVPHLFDPAQINGPTGGWIPQTGEMPTSATVTPPSPKQPAFPMLSGPPNTVISRTPTSNAEDLETLKKFLTLTGATAGSMALGPGAAAPWLTRAALGLTGAAAGGGTARAAADVPVNLYDYAAGRPSSPENDVGRDFAKGAEGGAGLEAGSLAAGPALGLAARGARWVGKLGGDVAPSWASQIPGGDKLWRPATAALRYFAGKTAGLPAVADLAAGTIPPLATAAAPRLAEAGEALGSKTLGERASGALQWLESKLPGILKADAPGAAAASTAAAADAEAPAVAASRARYQARQAAPARQAAEQAAGSTRVIEPDPTGPVSRPDDLSRRDFFRDPALPTQGQDWIERPTPTNPPAAAVPEPAPAAPAAPRPMGRSDQQWQQFRQPPRVTPAGHLPIGAPAVDPGIELNLTGPQVLPPTAADLAAPPAASTTTATDVLTQQARGTRQPLTAQQLEAAHAQMTAANAAAREAEAAAAGPLEGTPNARTLPDGSVIPWDDAAAQADAATFDPAAEFVRRHPEAGGDAYAKTAATKATAQERRMSALTNKAIRPDLLPESSGLRGADALAFNPETGEIANWDDLPQDTATDRLVRAMQRRP